MVHGAPEDILRSCSYRALSLGLRRDGGIELGFCGCGDHATCLRRELRSESAAEQSAAEQSAAEQSAAEQSASEQSASEQSAAYHGKRDAAMECSDH